MTALLCASHSFWNLGMVTPADEGGRPAAPDRHTGRAGATLAQGANDWVEKSSGAGTKMGAPSKFCST
jgi:hypothetical protein